MDHADHAAYATIQCPICERTVPADYTARHFLVPKSRKGKESVLLCQDCHNQIHVLFKPKDFERRFPTIELLKEDEQVKKWIEWISKRKP